MKKTFLHIAVLGCFCGALHYDPLLRPYVIRRVPNGWRYDFLSGLR